MATTVVRPAAGPEIMTCVPLIEPTRRPAKIPVINPVTGSAPDAMAIPRHSGTATRNVTVPASKSERRCCRLKMEVGVFINVLSGFESKGSQVDEMQNCRTAQSLQHARQSHSRNQLQNDPGRHVIVKHVVMRIIRKMTAFLWTQYCRKIMQQGVNYEINYCEVGMLFSQRNCPQ
jgi:hypothetical protein